MSRSLVVIGAGELGCRVAQVWRAAHPEARIILKTKTNKEERTLKWKNLGFDVAWEGGDDGIRAPYVVFCLPPTGIL